MTDHKPIKFREWVFAVYGTRGSAAKALGVTETSITRYMSGARFPRPPILARIEALSGGAVTARSFDKAAA